MLKPKLARVCRPLWISLDHFVGPISHLGGNGEAHGGGRLEINQQVKTFKGINFSERTSRFFCLPCSTAPSWSIVLVKRFVTCASH